MPKSRKKNRLGLTVGLIFLGLVYFGVLIKILLGDTNVALFNPQGMIAHEQHNLTMLIVAIMLVIAIPALFLVYFIAWKYRESNDKAKRNPDAGHGKWINVNMWLIPGIFLVVLTAILYPATHRLAPQKQIASGAEPLTIQVVALRWKWLFIYPEQQIATVNYVQVPKGTPVTFELTADETPMSAFWIPNLGGMLYAMTGHVNNLNLVADTIGEFPGSTAEINGAGFAGMKFTASVTSRQDFDFWAEYVNQSTAALNSASYEKLLEPSEYNKAAFYSLADSNLYAKVLMKYAGSHEGHMNHEMSHE